MSAHFGRPEEVVVISSCNVVEMSQIHWGQELYYAARDGDYQTVKQIVANQWDDPDFDIDYQTPWNGYTPLYIACAFGYISTKYAHFDYYPLIKFLLHHGADVNLPTPAGKTPLWIAASWGNRHIVRLLLQHGADPDVEVPRVSYFTPLHIAAYYKRFPEPVPQKYGVLTKHHAYHMAARYMLHILQTGQDRRYFPKIQKEFWTLKKFSAEDPYEDVPDFIMNIVSRYNHFAVVKELVEANAGINSPDEDGFTALHKAQLLGHVPMQKFLMENGAVTSAYF